MNNGGAMRAARRLARTADLLPFNTVSLFGNGGAMRDRTADLLDANQALSQLSYSPFLRQVLLKKEDGRPGQT